MAKPNMIGGGRYTRAETSGDRRRLEGAKTSRLAILARLWRYLGRNRTLVVLAMFLSVSGSLLASYGPKLSGEAINAIDLGTGNVDFDTVFRCCALMAGFYLLSSGNPLNTALGTPGGASVGHTDLLITWLFKMTLGSTDSKYYMASVVGILIFAVCAILSLIIYNVIPSTKNEEDFN